MTTSSTGPNIINLFVFNRFADWEVGLLSAHLNAFEGQFLPSRFRVQTVAADHASVVSMGGLTITPDVSLAELDVDACAMLVLPGGLGWEEGRHFGAVELAQRLLDAGIPVAAICGATFGLARAGLLDTRRHTSNAKEYLTSSGYAGTALYQAELAVCDGGLITANSTGVVEFASQAFRCLKLYPDPTLKAWHDLFKTGRAHYYEALMASLQQHQSSELTARE